MPDIHIGFAVDQKFGRYLHFAVASILFNAAPDDRLHFHILSHGIELADRERIVDMSREYPDARVEFAEFGYDDFRSFGVEKSDISPATFGRFVFPQVFQDVDKIIYLDGDLIVASSLAPLWNTALGDCCIGAALDQLCVRNKKHPASVGMRGDRYFNAGVMLLDCRKFREEDAYRGLLALGQSESFLFADQDMLNLFFEGRVKYLDPAWNVHTRQRRDAASRIIHYTAKKPWRHLFVCDPAYFWNVALRLPANAALMPEIAEQVQKTTWLDRRLHLCALSLLSALGPNRDFYRGKINAYRQIERLLPELRKYFG